MLKMLVKIIVAGLLTLLLAAVFLARNISDNLATLSVNNGDWTTSTSIGSEEAGVLLKAAVAIGGLLASTPENSMYYRLDSIDGEPLRLNCRYRIKGKDYDADWWSITAYGWDNYLIPNTQKRYAFNNDDIKRDEDGRWEIVVDRNQQTGNWLPVGPAGAAVWRKLVDYDFDLLLRLYTPGTAYLQMPQSAELPRVTQEACE